jgi:hypothetical protein
MLFGSIFREVVLPRNVPVSARQRRQSTLSTLRQTKEAIAPKQQTGYDAVELAELTAKARKKLPTSSFAVPSKRSKSGGSGGYPIPDRSHAQNALARVSQFGTPAEKAAVRAAVARKFPDMLKSKKPTKKGGK